MRWRCETQPDWIELRLFWFTEGKGTQDIGVVATERVSNPAMSGEHPFSLKAPAQPPSCSGKLVSIRWALELVSNVKMPIPRFDLIIAPEAKEILLKSVE
jgi:hypothetical protein